MSEILVIGMVFTVCALLLVGYPVALTLAGVSLLFAVAGSAAGIMSFALLGALSVPAMTLALVLPFTHVRPPLAER